MPRIRIVAAATLVLAVPAAAGQKAEVKTTPQQIERLIGCRALTDPAQRLACFDRESASTADAIARQEIVAFDREKMQQTRRSLFGFSVPKLGIFDNDKDEVDKIDGVIAGVGHTLDGVRVRLQDESRWGQTDGKPIALEPRVGDKVVIKRGALGSYVMSVAGQPGVKVKRLN